VLSRCSGCGAATDCAARELADARYARHHRLVVDTYCLQHPERYCAW
jgi:hypothetical protein